MRTDQLLKTDWQIIDDYIKPLLKRSLDLLPNAANEYLYGAREDGLFAKPLAVEDLDIAIVDEGYKLLTLKEPIIHDMAWTELKDDADYRHQSTRFEIPQDFLNNESTGRTINLYRTQ